MLLRSYQREAIDNAWTWLREQPGSPLVVLPTGAGKSAVLTTMCREAVESWNGRVLVLTHVKELLEQLYETINRVWVSDLGRAPVGLYSAGLGKRETDQPVIIAGIQSVYRRGTEIGRFDLVLVDEAHLIPKDGDGMYLSLLETLRVINPNLRLVGLTATPYRLDSGWLFGEGCLFAGICHDTPVRKLIDEGFLSPLRGKDGGAPGLAGVHKRGGEFIADELEAVMIDEDRVAAAIEEIAKFGADRRAWLIFCCGVKHAHMVADRLKAASSAGVAVVTGDTPAVERAELVRAYKARELRCLVNVNVLTTGFDAPHVDLVALLRPTCSPGLYYQMVGRGLRRAAGKTDCLILDLGGNIARHGPVDAIRVRSKHQQADAEPGEAPTKTCPTCREILPAAARMCNACGFEFPRELAKHAAKADTSAPLTVYEETWHDVQMVDWCVHTKRDAPPTAPKTLRLIYSYGFRTTVNEFICVEHQGFARRKAVDWWMSHGLGSDVPTTASAAEKALAEADQVGRFRRPLRVLLRHGDKYPELIGKELEEAGKPAVAAPETAGDANEPAFTGGSYTPDDEPPF